MTAIYLSSLLLIAALCGAMIYLVRRIHVDIINALRAENKELRDRLFAKNALPPSGVDLTEKYEARQERINEQRQERGPIPRNKGPLAKLTRKWTESDRVLVERKNIDATRGRLN